MEQPTTTSTDNNTSKEGAASKGVLLRCAECGSLDVEYTAWVRFNTNEILTDADGPTDAIWCPECQCECATIEDYGSGFDLWREGEAVGHFATFEEALSEAKGSDRPYEITGSETSAEVVR